MSLKITLPLEAINATNPKESLNLLFSYSKKGFSVVIKKDMESLIRVEYDYPNILKAPIVKDRFPGGQFFRISKPERKWIQTAKVGSQRSEAVRYRRSAYIYPRKSPLVQVYSDKGDLLTFIDFITIMLVFVHMWLN